jgi:hypothetical protein
MMTTEELNAVEEAIARSNELSVKRPEHWEDHIQICFGHNIDVVLHKHGWFIVDNAEG